ncbi:MAG: hypothetical protein Q9223_000325 [Gallowayella weberi]
MIFNISTRQSSLTFKHLRTLRTSTYSLASRNPFEGNENEADQAVARDWLKTFGRNTIPRKSCAISFSRSSGPGGQNVNKVNSKATLRLPLRELLPSVPNILHGQIKASQYYAEKSECLVIQADGNRKQADNVEACFTKLQHLILGAGRATVTGETSPEQLEKVKRLYECLGSHSLIC